MRELSVNSEIGAFLTLEGQNTIILMTKYYK